MSIVYYKMSLQGSSHIKDNIPCQDANDVCVLDNGWIVAAIADGVGSAKNSEIGSKLAIETSIAFIKKHIYSDNEWNNDQLQSIIKLSFYEVMHNILQQATNDNNSIENYDTTLSLIIYDGTNVVYGHCGDGGIIVLPEYGKHKLLSNIQKGEEFNAVFPLRSKQWIFGNSIEPIASILLATDGVLDQFFCSPIEQDGKRQILHKNCYIFMNNNKLKLKDQTEALKLQNNCIDFFNSDKAKSITDDKTVVVVLNTEIVPENIEYSQQDYSKDFGNRIEEFKTAQLQQNEKLIEKHLDQNKKDIININKETIVEKKFDDNNNVSKCIFGEKIKDNTKSFTEYYKSFAIILYTIIILFILILLVFIHLI